ncbi:glycine-rich domain-containing protein [Acetobacter oeni]|uniref:Glycine-rich domain-containing protein n=1 Tax=Acetobacter oeni TaxID=304077 RepID=A0A511XFR0_9PROT|nr:hypothetical protein [Acetobacter oeni]MBB3882288.1 hypothetical protein [Acetobacter oeni]NHO18041.1 hypothetical protein [Acetobacter oeni]GBR01095.1 hypothetical protein AA21952_0311 [Acetobacter oeni LMG 21952]GEN61792.1 hypothetical protein AOE01nite_00160 [Acetobacter oeni]
MDRVIVYPGQVVADTDTLIAQRNTEQAIGETVSLSMGTTGPYASGLAATCSGSDMVVNIAAGQIVAAAKTDPTAYGTLGASSAAVMRQYAAAATSFTITTSTAAQTLYIAATLSLSDMGAALLRYADAADATKTLSGVSNDGVSQPTLRAAVATLSISATASATGVVPVWCVTVPAGATVITQSMIALNNQSLFYPPIPQLAPKNSPVFTGTPQAPTPALTDSSTRIATTAFVTGWAAGNLLSQSCNTGPAATAGGSSSFTLTFDSRCKLVVIEICAGGGGGGGAATAGSATAGLGGGGGAGAYARIIIEPATFGASVPVVLGTGGRGGQSSSGAMSGNNGANSSLGSFLTLGGGSGGISILAGGPAIIAGAGGGGYPQITAATGVNVIIASTGEGGSSGHASGMSSDYFFGFGGKGGNSLGFAGGAESGSLQTGNNGSSGAGGSGACAAPTETYQNGGDGGPGWMIVSQYG